MTRAERMSEAAHGVARPVSKSERKGNASDAVFIGGNPISWAWSGCNPSRFRDRPSWPPDPTRWPARSQLDLSADEIGLPLARDRQGHEANPNPDPKPNPKPSPSPRPSPNPSPSPSPSPNPNPNPSPSPNPNPNSSPKPKPKP